MPRVSTPIDTSVSVLASALLMACGGDPVGPNGGGLPSPSVACASVTPVQLAVGAHVVVDPATTNGCIRVPAAGSAGAEYLLVLASTATIEGASGPFLLRGGNPSATAAPPATPRLLPRLERPPRIARPQEMFDGMLRGLERRLAADPALRGPAPAAVTGPAAAPPVGDQRTFKVCTNTNCSAFTDVAATARYVGSRIAVYLDDQVPTNDPLTDADMAELGEAFDDYHYPIDTTSFGRESDLDNNGVVIALMTDAVNALTPDCSDGRIVGYFFGGDLLVSFANSNRSEVFYTLVPAPATPNCTAVSRRQVVNNLKPTLIHEFQHMISFNQRVLVRGGSSEETWLNEALSHFAEELAGRLIPNSECTPTFTSCRSQYSGGNIFNVYDFMLDPEEEFLLFDGPGSLDERGASWIFLRWALDQFSPDTVLGRPTTRQLVQTTASGVANVVAATGGSFPTMVPQYLMALYLDDQAGFSEPTGRLRLKSWGLRSIFLDPANQNSFNGFPLVPEATTGSYSSSGTLRAGSGRHLLLQQAASGPGIDVHVVKNTAGNPLDAAVAARFGLVRLK